MRVVEAEALPDVAAAPVAGPDLAWTAGPASAGPPWGALLALAAVALLGARRPRRAAALLVVVALTVFAFESGVHSVHHLVDPVRAKDCALASASQHVSGVEADPVPVKLSPALRGLASGVPEVAAWPVRPLPPHGGRAPPASV